MCGLFPIIPNEKMQLLEGEYTKEDVYLALKSMGSWKAPGPDGFQAGFYQKAWSIAGDDLSTMVLNILRGGNMRPELAEALLVLIPKKHNLGNITQFRPISFCNVTFKLVTKVLVNRLKMILPDVISPN